MDNIGCPVGPSPGPCAPSLMIANRDLVPKARHRVAKRDVVSITSVKRSMQTQVWAIIRLKTTQGFFGLFLVLVVAISLNLSFEAQCFLHVLDYPFIHINTEIAVHSAPVPFPLMTSVEVKPCQSHVFHDPSRLNLILSIMSEIFSFACSRF